MIESLTYDEMKSVYNFVDLDSSGVGGGGGEGDLTYSVWYSAAGDVWPGL